MGDTYRRTRRIPVAVAMMLVTAALRGEVAAAKSTAAQKCQKAIHYVVAIDKVVNNVVVTRNLTAANLAKRFKCGNEEIKKRVKGAAGDLASCLTKAAVLSKRETKNREKLRKKLAKACPAEVITGARSENGLGFRRCASRDATCAAIEVRDAASLAACLECSTDFETDCLFAAVYAVPRPQCDSP